MGRVRLLGVTAQPAGRWNASKTSGAALPCAITLSPNQVVWSGSDHPDREVIDVSVRFAARIPVRPVRLIAEGCGLSRAEVERLITEGKLVSAIRVSGRLSGDFTFTLKR